METSGGVSLADNQLQLLFQAMGESISVMLVEDFLAFDKRYCVPVCVPICVPNPKNGTQN
jgi:hypothetical protein